MLAINRDCLARDLSERDAMQSTAQTDLNSFVAHAFAVKALRNTRLPQHLHRAMLQNASTNALLTILLRSCFYDYGLDAIEMQQMRKHETRGSGAYNPNLGLSSPHHDFPAVSRCPSSSSNALCAA